MVYVRTDIIITESAHLDIFLACWESESKRRMSHNHRGLALVPMTFSCTRYAMTQSQENHLTQSNYQVFHKRQFFNDAIVGRLENVKPMSCMILKLQSKAPIYLKFFDGKSASVLSRHNRGKIDGISQGR